MHLTVTESEDVNRVAC